MKILNAFLLLLYSIPIVLFLLSAAKEKDWKILIIMAGLLTVNLISIIWVVSH